MNIAVDIYLPIYSTCSSLVFSFLLDMTSNENLCAIVLDLVLGGWLNKPRSWFWRSAVVQISCSRSQNGRSCSTLPPCHVMVTMKRVGIHQRPVAIVSPNRCVIVEDVWPNNGHSKDITSLSFLVVLSFPLAIPSALDTLPPHSLIRLWTHLGGDRSDVSDWHRSCFEPQAQGFLQHMLRMRQTYSPGST